MGLFMILLPPTIVLSFWLLLIALIVPTLRNQEPQQKSWRYTLPSTRAATFNFGHGNQTNHGTVDFDYPQLPYLKGNAQLPCLTNPPRPPPKHKWDIHSIASTSQLQCQISSWKQLQHLFLFHWCCSNKKVNML